MEKIKVTFPDGNSKEFEKGITAIKIAESISSRLADDTLAVELNGVVKDLNAPINSDASIKFLTFEDEKGKEVYWHSTSHLMAHAIQEIYPEAKFGGAPRLNPVFIMMLILILV